MKDTLVIQQLARGRTTTFIRRAFAAGAKIPVELAILTMTSLVARSMNKDSRPEKIRRVSEVGKLFANTVLNVSLAYISPLIVGMLAVRNFMKKMKSDKCL
ncbi:MAG: hypothetical protein QGG99_03140 [Candidatus Poseidoniia archaeon]|jgi:hypothetical protein|nr:hypothetical protein [Candidatus Poseidoniia archaeon]